MYKNLANPEHPSHDEAAGLFACVAMLKLDPEAGFGKASRGLRADTIQYLEKKFPRRRFESAADQAQAIIDEIQSNLLPNSKLDREIAKPIIIIKSAATLGGDSFKEELALDERLDAMIDRKIKRLPDPQGDHLY